MPRYLKITLISIVSLLAVVVAVIAITVNVVFNKERITPLVQNNLPSFLTCPAELDEVELTFFSTFPNFVLHLKGFTLINPMEGAPSDTLLHVGDLSAILDAQSYLNEKKIEITSLHLSQGIAHLFLSADSVANFDVLPPSQNDGSPSPLDQVVLRDVHFDHVHFCYLDALHEQRVSVFDLSANVEGDTHLQSLTGKFTFDAETSRFEYSDSVTSLALDGMHLPLCEVNLPDSTSCHLHLSTSLDTLRIQLEGESPLQLALDHVQLPDFALSLKGSDLNVSGHSFEIDTLSLQLAGTSPMSLQLGRTVIDLPQTSFSDQFQAQFKADTRSITLNTPQEGDLLRNLPTSVSLQLTSDLDFNHIRLSDAHICAAKEEITLSADLDRLDSLTTHLSSQFTLLPTTFVRLLSFVPRAYRSSLAGIDLRGNLGLLTASASVMLKEGQQPLIESFDASTVVSNLHFLQDSQMTATAQRLSFEAHYPFDDKRISSLKRQQQSKRQKAINTHRRSQRAFDASFLQTKLDCDRLHFELHDSSEVVADLPTARCNLTLSDELLHDSQSLPFVSADFTFSKLSAQVDTLTFQTHQLSGSFTMADGLKGTKQFIEACFDSKDATIDMGQAMHVVSGPLAIEASSIFDPSQQDDLLRYNPLLNVKLNDGLVQMTEVPYPFQIPSIDFDFNLGRFLIRDSQFRYGDSDFQLTGEVRNLREYLSHEADLLAELQLKSRQTHVYQLMDLTELLAGVPDTAAVTTDADPFMVPLSVDLKLTTSIDRTLVGENEFNNLGGQLMIKDGNLVLEEMGFSSKAARMQLTALYRSPKRDNLFVGANFHLLDINVADLIHMVPEIDTIVPMLRSFDGKAEFHFAAETNLFGNYNVKMSTLKATGAIEGKDLTLLDGETFSTISKYLMFNKQTRNRIDTLSVEMAVNRRRMTLYPMLIGMDKYQAVISGNHELTGSMPFNYHISVTDCPVVGGHLGLDIEGDLEKPEDYTFKVVGCKYASLYKPERRNVTQEQTLQLKQLIADALKRTVRDQ